MIIHAHCSEFSARLSIVLNVGLTTPATAAPQTLPQKPRPLCGDTVGLVNFR